MFANIGLYSYGAAFLAYFLLTALVFVTRRSSTLGPPLLAATSLTALWAGVVAVSSLATHPLGYFMQLAEILRNAAWAFLLLRMISDRLQQTDHWLASKRWIPLFATGLAAILALISAADFLGDRLSVPERLWHQTLYAVWLAMSVLGHQASLSWPRCHFRL